MTNGPYVAGEYEKENFLRLTAGEHYDAGQQGPETLTFRFAATAEEGQALYDQKTVDVVWPLTEERLGELARDESWSPDPTLETFSVVYHCAGDPLEDQSHPAGTVPGGGPGTALAELAGVTAQAAEGLIPPGVPENEEQDFRTAGGALLDNDPELYSQRCDQARAVLSQAGYSGPGLGELEFLYVEESDASSAVARELCRQWNEVLEISVTPKAVTEQELWTALRSGEYTLAGLGLEAAGNDAECFLMDGSPTAMTMWPAMRTVPMTR